MYQEIVSQLVRSPGIYYGIDHDKIGKRLFSCTVIPNRGAWLEYETDANVRFPVVFALHGHSGESKNFYFQSTKLDVQEAKYHLNRNFIIRDMASLREFFAFLGILDQFPQELDDSYGWEVYSMYDGGLKPWIDFEDDQVVDPSTGIPINCIRFTWEPWFSPDGSPMSYGYEFDCPFDPPYTCGPKE